MQKLIQKINYWLGVAAVGVFLGITLQFARAWVEPTGTPPADNIGAPINTSENGQWKEGNLIINSGHDANSNGSIETGEFGANGLLVPYGTVSIGNINPLGFKTEIYGDNFHTLFVAGDSAASPTGIFAGADPTHDYGDQIAIIGANNSQARIGFFVDAPDYSNSMLAQIRGIRESGSGTPGSIAFLTRTEGTVIPTEKMRIKNTGNVGIGTDSPTQKLDVNGNIRVRSIGSGAYSGTVNRTSDGTLTSSWSDIRLKKNVEEIDNALGKVLAMRGVTYNWKDPNEPRRMMGMIAQEVQGVVPELVFQNPDDGYYGINYGETSALLIEAMKDLKYEKDAEIESLKKQNEELKKALCEIKADLDICK